MTTPIDLKNSVFYSQVWKRVHKERQNCNIVFDGENRTGKSWATLSAAWSLDRNPKKPWEHRFKFSQCADNFKDAMKFARNEENKIGSVVVWEETGFDALNRDALTELNKKISKFFQIVGRRRLIIIMNTPSFYYIDSQLRGLTHYRVTMKRNYSELQGYSTGQVKRIKQHNFKAGQIYQNYLKQDFGGYEVDVEKDLFAKPPVKLVDDYISREASRKDVMEDTLGTFKPTTELKKMKLSEFVNLAMTRKDDFLQPTGRVNRGKLYNVMREIYGELPFWKIADISSAIQGLKFKQI